MDRERFARPMRGVNLIKLYQFVELLPGFPSAKVTSVFISRRVPRSIYRTYEISVKSRRRIFRVTFTRPDWRWPIFDGERAGRILGGCRRSRGFRKLSHRVR